MILTLLLGNLGTSQSLIVIVAPWVLILIFTGQRKRLSDLPKVMQGVSNHTGSEPMSLMFASSPLDRLLSPSTRDAGLVLN